MNTLTRARSKPQGRGFTLIELLVAVAIVAILAAVALPTFIDSVRKGRRSDAFAAIAAIQQAQERWRANNPSYNSSLGSPPSGLNISEPANYGLAITDAAANGYVITATGRAAQASDRNCKLLSLRMLDGNITYAACENCTFTTASYTATNTCWSR
ncbi:Type IV pilus biogenesis protein PilE [Rubrivivax sp. A210]|uniref:type IV pilin protein n=1 Tax=Rubrivivax sp. A210 TaxID=2772301 RepID=UPI00191B3D15|nr:type IV pilin protein [Rubrivivax sp. A210]CAD5372081.1 Type IV pilus biogenesis protein PilE [Rubrivivax sp. A210]